MTSTAFYTAVTWRMASARGKIRRRKTTTISSWLYLNYFYFIGITNARLSLLVDFSHKKFETLLSNFNGGTVPIFYMRHLLKPCTKLTLALYIAELTLALYIASILKNVSLNQSISVRRCLVFFNRALTLIYLWNNKDLSVALKNYKLIWRDWAQTSVYSFSFSALS